MCQHQPPCPPADATDRQAAHVVASHPEQGWSLLCNGTVLFEDTGVLLPGGQSIPPHRPAVTNVPAPPAPALAGRLTAHRAALCPRPGAEDRQPAPRELVLQAALIEVAARGLDGTPAQDIAHRAGISQRQPCDMPGTQPDHSGSGFAAPPGQVPAQRRWGSSGTVGLEDPPPMAIPNRWICAQTMAHLTALTGIHTRRSARTRRPPGRPGQSRSVIAVMEATSGRLARDIDRAARC